MNDLEKYFYGNKGNLIHKWLHYFEIYDKHFKRFRGKEVTILEIGVSHGGSLNMWKNYFGSKVKIYGVDTNPRCKHFEDEQTTIYTGSQSDIPFLKKLKREIPKVDILLDDGGHYMDQQIITFEHLFDHVKDDGVYMCEDIHSSYMKKFNGGYKKEDTFIEYSKNFVDFLHAYHSMDARLKVSDFTKSVNSITYYDSIIVLEKMKRQQPEHQQIGHRILETLEVPKVASAPVK